MPALCVVPGCSRRGGHKFPDDGEIRSKWLVAIRRDKWFPNEHSRVCHVHFTDSDYCDSTSLGEFL